MDNVHTRIKCLRGMHNYTQGYVARKLETSQQAYSNYELGKREVPTRHVVKLAELYHVSTDYILGIKTELIDAVSMEAEYVPKVTFRGILGKMQKLGMRKRERMLSYLSFLASGSDKDT